MRDTPAPSKHHLSECLKLHYDIKVTSLTLLPVGADMQASVYKAQTSDHAAYFVKVRRGSSYDISTLIMELLCNAGIHHIIPIVKTTLGQTTQAVGYFTMTVFPFIEGCDGFSQNLTRAQWMTLGSVMRQIHEIKIPLLVQEKIPDISYSSKWRQSMRSLFPFIEANPDGDRAVVSFIRFVQEHRTVIEQVVNRAEQIARVAQEQSDERVLCHSDLHAGNIFLDKNGSLYIVDWDSPLLAPKERDLMFIGGGIGNVWNKTFEENLFYKGYGETQINKTLLAYYRYERILEDIAVYGQQLLLSSGGGTDRMKWYQHFIDQFEPNGVIDIAFKTDKDFML